MRILTGGHGQAAGKAFVFSEGLKCRVAMPFDSADYWGEHFVFEPGKTDVGFAQAGARSGLGNFLRNYDLPLREGLVSGALSTAWPLLDLAGRQGKLDYDGVKKVEGKEVHQLSHKAKSGQGDMKILLFFEPDTFRHVRTLYSLTLSAGLGPSITVSSQQQDTRRRPSGPSRLLTGLPYPRNGPFATPPERADAPCVNGRSPSIRSSTTRLSTRRSG
jgi:hypothetical protein